LLRRTIDLPASDAYSVWAAIGRSPIGLPPVTRMLDLGEIVERAFDAVAEEWWDIGRQLSTEPGADLAHTPACVSNLSDFGLMLAWTHIVRAWVSDNRKILLTTDDPWMFRHLSGIGGVIAGSPPPLRLVEAKLWLRGYLSRLRTALRFAASAIALRSHRNSIATGNASILVYGHPASNSDGDDGYFGNLMRDQPDIRRVLHIDCLPATARTLAEDGRTHSLHGWGNPLAAARLVRARWKPSTGWRQHKAAWLVRRAASREGGTAAGAAIRWQQHCQRNWLRRATPRVVVWPWENHSWERAFVRECRTAGVATVGYQHSVVGRQMLNYAPASNPDGLQSIPDRILTSGPATAHQLESWKLPGDRITIGGAWRISRTAGLVVSETAPVFMPLPFDGRIAAEMIAAAKSVPDRIFLVKPHPMTPHAFAETDTVRHTDLALAEHTVLSAVVYAASTVGLESLIAGIPTFRFQPWSCMALDILPSDLNVPAVAAENLGQALENPVAPASIDRDRIFAAPDLAVWRRFLEMEAQDAKPA
jgi:hypothetical protein